MRPICPNCGGDIKAEAQPSFVKLIPFVEKVSVVLSVSSLLFYLYSGSLTSLISMSLFFVIFVSVYWLIPRVRYECQKCDWRGRM